MTTILYPWSRRIQKNLNHSLYHKSSKWRLVSMGTKLVSVQVYDLDLAENGSKSRQVSTHQTWHPKKEVLYELSKCLGIFLSFWSTSVLNYLRWLCSWYLYASFPASQWLHHKHQCLFESLLQPHFVWYQFRGLCLKLREHTFGSQFNPSKCFSVGLKSIHNVILRIQILIRKAQLCSFSLSMLLLLGLVESPLGSFQLTRDD